MQKEIIYITDELASAKDKYPVFPKDLIHRVSIMNEEAGEAIRAALNIAYHGYPIEELEAELVQTAAMCIRCLESIEEDRKAEEQIKLF